jgi:hypothetical protein
VKKSKCIFTLIHNEPQMFPIWLSYYQQFFESSDIYVSNGLKIISCDFDIWIRAQSGFCLMEFEDRMDKDTYIHQRAKVEEVQRELLKSYEVVLFSDVDEFICHRIGLTEYINNWNSNRLLEVLNGYEVVHMFRDYPKYNVYNGYEPDIDLSRPILSQRRFWYHSKIYSKPLVTRIPLNYCYGMHCCAQAPHFIPTDPSLILLHLHKIDFKLAHERKIGRLNNSPDWNFREPTLSGPGYQNTLISERAIIEGWLSDWWFANVDDPNIKPAPYELIPDWVKEFPL